LDRRREELDRNWTVSRPRRPPRFGRTALFAGLSRVGDTGLEPVTSALSKRSTRVKSLPAPPHRMASPQMPPTLDSPATTAADSSTPRTTTPSDLASRRFGRAWSIAKRMGERRRPFSQTPPDRSQSGQIDSIHQEPMFRVGLPHQGTFRPYAVWSPEPKVARSNRAGRASAKSLLIDRFVTPPRRWRRFFGLIRAHNVPKAAARSSVVAVEEAAVR
jgi:hypothetical protein